MFLHVLPLCHPTMKILAIDPSVNNVGIAYYDTETKEIKTSCFHPNRTGKIGMDTRQIYSHLILRYGLLQKEKKPDVLILEYPNWQGSTKGLIAMQQGYTIDLAFVVGHLSGLINAPHCQMPTPLDWKKNIPKAATQARVRRYFSPQSFNHISEHEFDALGMIIWYLER